MACARCGRHLVGMNTHPYPSDLSDEEWAILGPLITPDRQAGHPRLFELRRVVDAVFYLLRTGCQWRAMPHEYPPWPTVFYHFAKWRSRHRSLQLGAEHRDPGSACRAHRAGASWRRTRTATTATSRRAGRDGWAA
ncbi:MAG: transposase [Acetobacteraceae bacterium]|nr:transposase [Acetobacteraceae bacterium]